MLILIIIMLVVMIVSQFVPIDKLFRRLNPVKDDNNYHLPENLQSHIGGPTRDGPDPSSREFTWKDGIVHVKKCVPEIRCS